MQPIIPVCDLKAQNDAFKSAFADALAAMLSRGFYVMGSEHQAFEQEFAAYIGAAHVVAVANGTDALELALRALDVQPGDEVITVANAGFYSSTAILALGATPVYVDVQAGSMTMDVAQLPALINKKTKAIIVTHLYGMLADMPAILRAAGDVPVVEDVAQAHGARSDAGMAGSFGTLATFSFYPTKNLGALGDGGAVATNNPTLAEAVKRLRQYGWQSKYQVVDAGKNSRMDELQAAFLRIKLPHLDAWNQARRAIVQRYFEALKATDKEAHLLHCNNQNYVAHLCILKHPERARIQQKLLASGIQTAIHYPIADHQQPIMRQRMHRAENLPVTERLTQEILTLPCYPEMPDASVERVCAALREVI